MKILLKKIRSQRGITLRQLSRLSGVSASEINRIENEEIQPTAITLCYLAKALQVKICDLIDCEESNWSWQERVFGII